MTSVAEIDDLQDEAGRGSRLVLHHEDLVAGKYVDADAIMEAAADAGAGVVVLKAGRGRGKTTLAASWAKQTRRAGGRVVGSAPTQTLSRALAAALDVPCYLDLASDEYIVGGDLVTCTPSIHRARVHQFEPGAGGLLEDPVDLVVLDEVEQQVRSLAGRHLGDAEARRGWDALVRRVRVARRVLLLDADAGPLTEELLAAAGRSDVLWINAPGDALRGWKEYPRRSSLVTTIEGWVSSGERVATHCRSERFATALGLHLQRQFSNKKVVALTPKTIGEVDLTDLTWMADIDVLVYSPVLGTGVSLDAATGHWDRMAAFCAEHTGTADDVLQGIGRVRDMKEVHIWGPRGSRPDAWEVDPEQVYFRWLAGEGAARRKLGIERNVPDDILDDTRADGYTRAMATVYAVDRARGSGWQFSALLALLGANGEKIEEAAVGLVADEDEKVAAAEVKAEREAVALQDAEEVVDARDLDHTEAASLRRRPAKNRDDAAALARYSMGQFYGGEFTDADRDRQIEIALGDEGGRRRMKLRRFAWVLAQQDGATGRHALECLDHHDLDVDGISPLRFQARSTTATVVNRLLEKAGLLEAVSSHLGIGDLQEQAGHRWGVCPDGSVVIDAAKVADAARWASDHRQLLCIMGVPCRRDAADKPMSWLQDLLRWIGLATHGLGSTRTGRRGEHRVRTYYLDLDDIAEAHRLANHYYDGLIAGVTPESDPPDPREAAWMEQIVQMRERVADIEAWLAAA